MNPPGFGTLSITAPPLALRDALERFEREAVHGVCDTGRYRCSYYTWGSGPPLLFIPGLCDRGRSYVLLAALLSEQFRCIAYDYPIGRGDGADLRRCTHADLVADAYALLDHLHVGQSYLLGSSFGSTIVLKALHAYSQRFPKGVLLGGFACRSLFRAELLLARVARFWPGQIGQLPFRARAVRRYLYRGFTERPPELWSFFLEQTGARPIAAVARHALLLHQVDLRPLLPQVRQPVLMICGDADPLVGKACEEALLSGLPNVGRVELPGCGHFPMFTHAEVTAEIVRRYLNPFPCMDSRR